MRLRDLFSVERRRVSRMSPWECGECAGTLRRMSRMKSSQAFGLGVAAFVLSTACAPENTALNLSQANAPVTQVRQADAKPLFFWDLRSADGTAQATLLGSVHVGREDFFPLAPSIERAFAVADTLVVEVDVNGPKRREYERLRTNIGVLDAEDSLRRRVSAETYGRLADFLTERNLESNAFDQLKPWAASIAVTMQFLKEGGYGTGQGVDHYFLRRARGAKNIVSLESFEFQMRLFDEMSRESQEGLLVQSLDDASGDHSVFERMVDAWRRGSPGAMERVIGEYSSAAPEFRRSLDNLLYRRNETMAESIVTLVSDGRKHFVVVGAAHLVGHRGIPSLLKRRGFRVRQVFELPREP